MDDISLLIKLTSCLLHGNLMPSTLAKLTPFQKHLVQQLLAVRCQALLDWFGTFSHVKRTITSVTVDRILCIFIKLILSLLHFEEV